MLPVFELGQVKTNQAKLKEKKKKPFGSNQVSEWRQCFYLSRNVDPYIFQNTKYSLKYTRMAHTCVFEIPHNLKYVKTYLKLCLHY